jgi:hypothetical protein
VAVERRRAVAAEAQARAREAALRAEHGAEVARLIDLLREAARRHACEIARRP